MARFHQGSRNIRTISANPLEQKKIAISTQAQGDRYLEVLFLRHACLLTKLQKISGLESFSSNFKQQTKVYSIYFFRFSYNFIIVQDKQAKI